MMTVLEQRFMERVPGLLHDLTEAIQGLTEAVKPKQEPEHVWVFTAEQAYDYCSCEVVVKTFGTEESARRFLHDFIHEGDDSIARCVEEKGWCVDSDEPDHYMAYREGSYPQDHVDCTITKCEILK